MNAMASTILSAHSWVYDLDPLSSIKFLDWNCSATFAADFFRDVLRSE
jgi:hypothetical protein